KTRSAPQKQPSPNTAFSVSAGYGPASRWPLTKCRSGTGIGSVRPGRHCSGPGTTSLLRINGHILHAPRVKLDYASAFSTDVGKKAGTANGRHAISSKKSHPL